MACFSGSFLNSMRTDISEKGLEDLILAVMTGGATLPEGYEPAVTLRIGAAEIDAWHPHPAGITIALGG
jgi:hypothetical protein